MLRQRWAGVDPATKQQVLRMSPFQDTGPTRQDTYTMLAVTFPHHQHQGSLQLVDHNPTAMRVGLLPSCSGLREKHHRRGMASQNRWHLLRCSGLNREAITPFGRRIERLKNGIGVIAADQLKPSRGVSTGNRIKKAASID